ncbi:Uncharacterized [Syntrophomonas zehnderi OL-4]|uniref:Uncharacterized n=1 Tax=Syntrophomonas zehnderi OL-4 TaxID=690567 RepID=A0A0E4C9S0_9FIRM|nr:hypothetical protein [Syntrophomonas zehnderi]CFY09704.1 Uncharacterized [Syntrophomonas zehnderi OL-4]
MKKTVICFVLSLFFLSSLGTGAIASESTIDQDTMSIQIIDKGFIYPNMETLMKNVSTQITRQFKKEKQSLTKLMRTSSLKIGTDKTYTSADYGSAYYTVVNGTPDCQYTWGTTSGGYADAAIDVDMVTQNTRGTSWAWVGNRVSIQANDGLTQDSCRVDFDGWVKGSLYQTAYLTGSQVAVWAEIYDETDDELVVQYEDWYIQNQVTTINRAHDEGGTVTLKAGHVYQFRMVLYTEAYDLVGLGNITYADCYNGARGNDGLDYSSIILNW